jgi:hypothetical protein
MRADLASRGEPSKLNERKVGDILTSLGLTNRDRTNTGYVLNLERSTRVRIHEMARDYEVDGTGQNQNCDICKQTHTSSPAGSTREVADDKQPRSEDANREHRERRERGPANATRAATRPAKRSRSPRL